MYQWRPDARRMAVARSLSMAQVDGVIVVGDIRKVSQPQLGVE